MIIVAGAVAVLTIATSPAISGAVVTLDVLYGIDGDPTGLDGDGADLVFPVTLEEGSSGAYSAEFILGSVGVYWARVSVAGAEYATILIRVVPDTADYAADSGTATDIGAVIVGGSASANVSMTYRDATSAGSDPDGVAYVWPQAMQQVPGYTDSWYFEDVVFSDGGPVQIRIDPATGPAHTSVIQVRRQVQVGTYGHFDGFIPDDAYDPSDWVTVSYMRRWTGWASDVVTDETVRELRSMAIETFTKETNCFAAAWIGTWKGLLAQGTRLYLPMPIILPAAGGTEPVVKYTTREGDQDDVQTIALSRLEWRVSGLNAKQPYVELFADAWDPTLAVSITASWGLAVPGQVPIRVRQALVGLARWHSLSFGVDGELARDQSTSNRTTDEANRDVRFTLDPSAIGRGITGDRTVDRLLAELTVPPGPWVVRNGDR